MICNTCRKKWPYFHDHHDQTLWLCRSSNTRTSVILSLYVTPLPFHPSLPSSHSFTLCLLGPSRTTETCCTRCAGGSLGSDVPCTHLLLLLSFSTLLKPAAKQTLPVPSIPAGGWKSSLPEIAQIIALQWYFLLLSFIACASPLLHLFPFQSFFVSSSFQRAFLWKKKRENSQLIFFLFLRGTRVRKTTLVCVGFPEM